MACLHTNQIDVVNNLIICRDCGSIVNLKLLYKGQRYHKPVQRYSVLDYMNQREEEEQEQGDDEEWH